MKIDFSSQINHAGTGGIHDLTRKRGGGTSYLSHITEQTNTNKAVQKNLSRPASQNGQSGSVSFKGGPTDAMIRLAKNEKFNKFIGYVLHNESMFSAIITLGILTTIRPILTLMMPVADGKDKVAVASKEIVGGFVGYGLATLIAKPVNVGIVKLTRNPAKYIKNNNTLIKKLTEDDKYLKTFTSFWKNMPEMGSGILKAAITVALMPFVIKGIDAIRGGKKKGPVETTPEEIAISQKIYNSDNQIYQKIAGGAK